MTAAPLTLHRAVVQPGWVDYNNHLNDGYYTVIFSDATTAFMAYAMSHPAASIWFGRSWSATFKYVIDGLIYGLMTGGVFGWLWPHVVPA